MTDKYDTTIDILETHLAPVLPKDTLAEAGRKVLLADFIHMLKHEAGSRSGADIEDIHQMRVAIRRMRSTFRLLTPYFKPKRILTYRRRLKKIARALGEVRDLDVMIQDFSDFHAGAQGDQHTAVQKVVRGLDDQRATVRHQLIVVLDDHAYAQFVEEFGAFLIATTREVKSEAVGVIPVQVRHLAPVIVHARLAAVRAYDDVLPNADAGILHALRVEFKRLRYAVALFTDVLGSPIKEFVEDLKTIQNHLGRLNDINVALARVRMILEKEDNIHTIALGDYFSKLDAEARDLQANFLDVWGRFNSRTTQRKLSDALLVLR